MTEPLASNCVPLLVQAGELGLKLEIKDSKTLTVEPAERLTPDLADQLRANKWFLLTMLTWPFVMVYSKTLQETIYFCEDEATKAALVQAGADEWSIYTKDELRLLVAHNRIAPISPDELCKVHEIKRTFHGRIAK